MSDFWSETFSATTAPQFEHWTCLGIELGEGATGVVLKYQSILNPDEYRAVKVVRSHLSHAVQASLAAEARLLKRLVHENIVILHDHGSDPQSSQYWLMMSLIDGPNIRDYCQTIDTSLEDIKNSELLQKFQSLCEAVEYAHRRRVQHNDIKPSNVLVDRDGTLKLLDFNIAHILKGEGNSKVASGLSYGYAAPEQIFGRGVDPRTDIFSLGVLFAELLGVRIDRLKRRFPDQASYAEELGKFHGDLRTKISNRDVLSIIQRATELAPESRYQTAKELLRDMEELRARGTVSARLTRDGFYRWRRRLANPLLYLPLSLAVISMLLCAVIYWNLQTQSQLTRARDLEVQFQRELGQNGISADSVARLELLLEKLRPLEAHRAELLRGNYLEKWRNKLSKELEIASLTSERRALLRREIKAYEQRAGRDEYLDQRFASRNQSFEPFFVVDRSLQKTAAYDFAWTENLGVRTGEIPQPAGEVELEATFENWLKTRFIRVFFDRSKTPGSEYLFEIVSRSSLDRSATGVGRTLGEAAGSNKVFLCVRRDGELIRERQISLQHTQLLTISASKQGNRLRVQVNGDESTTLEVDVLFPLPCAKTPTWAWRSAPRSPW